MVEATSSGHKSSEGDDQRCDPGGDTQKSREKQQTNIATYTDINVGWIYGVLLEG